MRKSRILAILLAFVGLSVVMASGLTAVWLTEEIRVLSLMILPSTVVATLLILYFEWRGKLLRQVGAEADSTGGQVTWIPPRTQGSVSPDRQPTTAGHSTWYGTGRLARNACDRLCTTHRHAARARDRARSRSRLDSVPQPSAPALERC